MSSRLIFFRTVLQSAYRPNFSTETTSCGFYRTFFKPPTKEILRLLHNSTCQQNLTRSTRDILLQRLQASLVSMTLHCHGSSQCLSARSNAGSASWITIFGCYTRLPRNSTQICCRINPFHHVSSGLTRLLDRHGLRPHLYADDTQICGCCSPAARAATCIYDTLSWMR
jgi:hypothetical protein